MADRGRLWRFWNTTFNAEAAVSAEAAELVENQSMYFRRSPPALRRAVESLRTVSVCLSPPSTPSQSI